MKTENNIINKWGVVCKNSSIDQATNTLSVFNILEDIQIANKAGVTEIKKDQKMFVSFPSQLITLWERERDGVEKPLVVSMRTELIDPAKQVLQTNISDIKFDSGKHRLRIIADMSGFPITIGGTYSFRVSLKEDSTKEFTEMTTVSLEVKLN